MAVNEEIPVEVIKWHREHLKRAIGSAQPRMKYLFKRLFAPGHPEIPIDVIIDKLDPNTLVVAYAIWTVEVTLHSITEGL